MPDPYNRYIWKEDAYIFRSELPHLISRKYKFVVAELGIGNGTLLRDMAKNHPDGFFLGVELYHKPLGKAAKRIHGSGIQNVQLIRYNALHPAILFPDHFLDGMIVNFPEPWPKLKHHRNRIFYGPFAQHVRKILKPMGWIFLQTDQKAYFDESKRQLSKADFQVCESQFPSVMAPLTKSYFHQLFDTQGDPIYRLLATAVD